jgi:hypothetical protein
MNQKDSRLVLKTSGAGDSLAEFNYAPGVSGEGNPSNPRLALKGALLPLSE